VIVYENGFELYSSKKTEILDGTVVDGEHDLRLARGDITKRRGEQER
jgi:hypothetical protein